MKVTLKSGLLAVGALAASTLIAWAAGNYSTYPIVGSGSFCGSTVSGAGGYNAAGNVGGGGATGQGQASSGSLCAQTIPAGPPDLTGTELVPADTGLASGASPQSVTIPSALLGSINTKINRLIGGDFAINLWQRPSTLFTSITPSTATMTADRWYTYSSANTVSVSKQTGAADTIPAQALYASMRVSRPSSTNTSQICVGQVLDKNWTAPLLGNNAVLSFWALAGSGLAAVDTNNNLAVTIAYYTAADSTTPGTNTGTFASGTITGYTANVVGGVNGTTATVASGVATVPISTTWTRYGVYAPIPATTTSGTAITGVGISICYTPASGTGGATEYFEIEGAQLQAMPSAAATNLPNGVISWTGFERRSPQSEADYQLWYSLVLNDGASTLRYAMGQATATTSAVVVIPFDNPMRETPATTINTAASFAVTTSTGAAQNCTALTAVATSNTTASGALQCQVASGLTAGNATQMIGQNTTGATVFSAEP